MSAPPPGKVIMREAFINTRRSAVVSPGYFDLAYLLYVLFKL